MESISEVTEQQRAEIDAQLRQERLSPRLRERLEMVKACSLGQDIEAISAWSGRTPRTVKRCLSRFEQQGLEGLRDAQRSGRPKRADETYIEKLETAVETRPRDLGLSFDVWTSQRLSAYLQESTGVKLSPGWLRALLSARRFWCRRPEHTLGHLEDAEDVSRCEAQIVEARKSGGYRS